MSSPTSSITGFLILSLALHGGLAYFHFFERRDAPEDVPLSFSLVFTEIAETPREIFEPEAAPPIPQTRPEERPPVEEKKEQPVPQKAMLKPEPRAKEFEADIAELEQERREQAQRVIHQDNAALLTYEQAILALLERNKRYPTRALRRGVEGEARLFLEIDRTGRVISRSIQVSSGSSLLDEEVLAMVSRASPFPQMPSHYSKASAQFSIPVEFVIN